MIGRKRNGEGEINTEDRDKEWDKDTNMEIKRMEETKRQKMRDKAGKLLIETDRYIEKER